MDMVMGRWSAFGGQMCEVVVQEVMISEAWWEIQALSEQVQLWVHISYVGISGGRARSML